MVKKILRELEKKMKISIEHFGKDLSKLRTGRASLGLFEDIKVDCYGSLTPISQVATLGIPIPPLDEERRMEIAKHIKDILEDEKTTLRIMRRESKEKIEELEEKKEITEDDKYWGYDKLQEVTDEYTKKIEGLAKTKEKEILEL